MISNNPINIKIKCRPINVTGTGSPGCSCQYRLVTEMAKQLLLISLMGRSKPGGCFPRAFFFLI